MTFIKFGDLVSVAGYENRTFSVVGYRIEHHHYVHTNFTEVVFELTDVQTSEWMETDENDLTLICRESQASEYIARLPLTQQQQSNSTHDMEQLLDSLWEESEPSSVHQSEPRKLTPREVSSREAESRKQLRKIKAEIIDELLERRNDYRLLFETFGDEEYNDMVFAIDAELFKLTEEVSRH